MVITYLDKKHFKKNVLHAIDKSLQDKNCIFKLYFEFLNIACVIIIS